MRSFCLTYRRFLTVVSLLFLLFTFSAPVAFASTRGSGSGDPSQPSATIQNPRVKQHSLALKPNEAEACNALIIASQSGTTMRGSLNVTCIGGTAYWIYSVMYSEHCIASITGWCWAGWNQTNTLPECSAHNVAVLNCGPYLREAVSSQLWRWRADTCVQYLPGDVSQCVEGTYQLQF